jgi:hypothetical protein
MRTLLSILASTILLAVAASSGAVAASPHQVDPAAMVPPLNPAYDPWICTDTGAGPVCRGTFTDSWSNADTGLLCGDRPIYTTGSFDSAGTRWHLPDGRATHTVFQDKDVEVWSLSPTGAGPILNVSFQWIEHFDYPIPGDRSTRVATSTGSYWQVTAKGHGLVWHDVGLVQFAPGSGDEIVVTHGPTDSDYGNLDLVLPTACAILAG